MEEITITNGTGTAQIEQGNYTVSANVKGYDNSTINPTSVTIDSSTNTYNFTIAANGTLTLHVTEDGTAEGTPIVGATFYRTDQSGTEYGNIITTNASGNATFYNVPYDTDGMTIYYKQVSSDGSHDFSKSVSTASLTTQSTTIQILNPAFLNYTFNLTDSNYENIPVSGTLNLTK